MSDCHGSLHRIVTDDPLNTKGPQGCSDGDKEQKHKTHESYVKSTASKSLSQASTPYTRHSDQNQSRMNPGQDDPVEGDERPLLSYCSSLPSQAVRSALLHDRASDTASGVLVHGSNKFSSARASYMPSHGSTLLTHSRRTVGLKRSPLPIASGKLDSNSKRSRSSSLATRSDCADEKNLKGSSHVHSEWTTVQGELDPPSIPSRPTASCECSQCLAPKSEKQARCETATPSLSEASSKQGRLYEGCWGECDECRQSQPRSKHTRSPSPSWRCDRDLDYCGRCNFRVQRPRRPYIQGAGCEQERRYDERKAFDEAFAGCGTPSIVGGRDDSSRVCLRGLDERSAREGRISQPASQGRLPAAHMQTTTPADVVDTQSRPIEQNGYIRKFKERSATMDSRMGSLDDTSHANVEDRLRQFEHRLFASLGRLEDNARVAPSIPRYEQGMTGADLDLRDLAKQALKMNLHQKLQREQMVPARLEKIEKMVKDKESAPATQHTAQPSAREMSELQELLMQQKTEISKLREEIAILPELCAEVVNLREDAVWTMDRINALENLAYQQERTGQTDINDQGGCDNRGYSESIGHASVMPPGYRTFSYPRARKITTPGFEQEFVGEWGQPFPAGKSHGTPPIASPMSRNGWNQVPQAATQRVPSFSHNGWVQRNGTFDGGWGRPPSSLNDSDRTNTPMSFEGRRWGIVGDSWGDGGGSAFRGRGVDAPDRTQRAGHMGWGSPGGQYDETTSMRSLSQPRTLPRPDVWKSEHIGLINLDAANTSTVGSQRRCGPVETISDADLVSRRSSIGSDWNHINSRRGRNEIVPFPPSREAHSVFQTSDSWDDISTVNHPPRPTKPKPHGHRAPDFCSDGSKYEREEWMRSRGPSPASWSQADGQGWDEDRRRGLGGGWGGDAERPARRGNSRGGTSDRWC